MKLRTRVVIGLIMLVSTALAQPPPKLADLDDAAPSPTPRPTPTPLKKPAPKKDEIGTIEGMTIPRGSGFLGLAVVGGNFKLSFYDAKKKPVAPDVSRASLRWHATYKLPDEHVVLLPAGDGKSLTAGKTIRPPLTFKLFITLLTDGAADDGGETFVVDFHG